MKSLRLLLIVGFSTILAGGWFPVNHSTQFSNIPLAEAAIPKKGTVTRKVTVREPITFNIQRVDDPKLTQGVEKIKRKGKNGTKTFKYKVTYTDGKEVNRELISEKITKKPKDQIVRVGIKKPAEVKTSPPAPVSSTGSKTTTKPNPKTNTPSTNTAVTPKPTPTPAPTSGSHVDKDCSDFTNHAAAQAYFEANGGSPTNNFDDLDRDHDGLACEALP